MEILYLLIPVSIALVFIIGAIFWWALKNQQFDDLDDEAHRIFYEDELSSPSAVTPSIDEPNSKNLIQ